MLGTEGFWVQRLKEISSFPPSPSLHYREIPGTETQRIFLTVIPGTDTYSREIPLLFPLPSLPLGRSRVQRLREFSRIFPIGSLGTRDCQYKILKIFYLSGYYPKKGVRRS